MKLFTKKKDFFFFEKPPFYQSSKLWLDCNNTFFSNFGFEINLHYFCLFINPQNFFFLTSTSDFLAGVLIQFILFDFFLAWIMINYSKYRFLNWVSRLIKSLFKEVMKFCKKKTLNCFMLLPTTKQQYM